MALRGLRVLELAGLAPVPFVGMMLADAGAQVVRVDRPFTIFPDVLARGKRSLIVDTKAAGGRELLRALVATSCDVLLDPYRPGVLEKMLGISSSVQEELNTRVILCRLTGYGVSPRHDYRNSAGHDINFLAVSGCLSLLRAPLDSSDSVPTDAATVPALPLTLGRPQPPSNLLADFAGGSLLATNGILLALLQRHQTGAGQTIDASITDGTAYLATLHFQLTRLRGGKLWSQVPFLQPGAAPYYDTFRCATSVDHHHAPGDTERFVAVGAIEPPFFCALMRGLSRAVPWPRAALQLPAAPSDSDDTAPLCELQQDRARWPALRAYVAEAFMSRPMPFWTAPADGVFSPRAVGSFPDACVTPVLTLTEAMHLQRTGSLDGLPWALRSSDASARNHTPEATAARRSVPLPSPVLSSSPDRFRSAATGNGEVESGSEHVRACEAVDAEQGLITPGANTTEVLRELLAGEAGTPLVAGHGGVEPYIAAMLASRAVVQSPLK